MPDILRPEVEAAAPGDLRALEEQRLADGLLLRAARSALYRDRWREAGVDPAAVRSLDDLQRLPYIQGPDLREVWRHPRDEVLCDPDVRVWFATSGTTGAPKWTPYGRGEFAMFEDVVLRAYRMIATRDGDFRCTIFSTPAPFVSDASAYALLASCVRARLPVESVITSPSAAEATLRFLAARRPTAVIGFPSLLLRIAEGITEEAPRAARAEWRHERSLRSLAGVVATAVVRIQPRHIFRPRVGLFGGEPLAPYRKPLQDAWGIRSYELYGMTEFPCFHVECPEQTGIHVWADWCIPELIPLQALEHEEADPAAVPAAHHLFDASPGAVGEFVFTSFTTVLPLIRYRTGDVIEVIDTARCGCGRTHPRIRVRGRRDDLVNLGLVRFSTAELDQRLGALHGVVSWQLRITRRGYKPLPVLYLVPATPNPTGLAAEAARALDGIEILRLGVEHGLVLAPEVKVVPEIREVRTWTGKRRRVIEEAPE
jgi:phenylacetate-CoA ligase